MLTSTHGKKKVFVTNEGTIITAVTNAFQILKFMLIESPFGNVAAPTDRTALIATLRKVLPKTKESDVYANIRAFCEQTLKLVKTLNSKEAEKEKAVSDASEKEKNLKGAARLLYKTWTETMEKQENQQTLWDAVASQEKLMHGPFKEGSEGAKRANRVFHVLLNACVASEAYQLQKEDENLGHASAAIQVLTSGVYKMTNGKPVKSKVDKIVSLLEKKEKTNAKRRNTRSKKKAKNDEDDE